MVYPKYFGYHPKSRVYPNWFGTNKLSAHCEQNCKKWEKEPSQFSLNYERMRKMERKEYVTPRKVVKGEKPQKSRPEHIDEVRLQLMKNIDQIAELARKLKPEIDKYNQKVEARFNKRLEEARRGKKTFSKAGFLRMKEEQFYMYRYAYKEAYYRIFEELRTKSEPECRPDIDNLSGYRISPGQGCTLNGTCFGPSQGKVLLQITWGGVVELEVISWTNTRVVAALSEYISGLRPYYGKIWLQRGDGLTSNQWPMQFIPIYIVYLGGWSRDVWGGLFGKSVNGTALEDIRLNDPDFRIFYVSDSHSGDGWSTLESPYSSGQNVEQGYHIGVNAWGNAYMTIIWQMDGPKGINPPDVGLYWLNMGPV